MVLATSSPHLVLDGAELVARALGAVGIKVCVAHDRPATANALALAIDERAAAGLLSVPTEVVTPPGRYVSGEESALVTGSDGGESTPTFRVEKPTILRVGGRPTLVDNAETMANIGLIGRYGPVWFREVGAPDAPGTTLLTVSGAVSRPGIYEIPLGTRVDRVLTGAGADSGIAAVLLGGYGGAWLGTAALLLAAHPECDGDGRCVYRRRCRGRPRDVELRPGRDGTHCPLDGRGERRTVRTVCVRAPRHRRGPDAARRRALLAQACSSASATASTRWRAVVRAGTLTAWSASCAAPSRSSADDLASHLRSGPCPGAVPTRSSPSREGRWPMAVTRRLRVDRGGMRRLRPLRGARPELICPRRVGLPGHRRAANPARAHRTGRSGRTDLPPARAFSSKRPLRLADHGGARSTPVKGARPPLELARQLAAALGSLPRTAGSTRAGDRRHPGEADHTSDCTSPTGEAARRAYRV